MTIGHFRFPLFKKKENGLLIPRRVVRRCSCGALAPMNWTPFKSVGDTSRPKNSMPWKSMTEQRRTSTRRESSVPQENRMVLLGKIPMGLGEAQLEKES